MRFTKMQGIGNDYIYINGFVERVPNPPELARRMADRHFGVGADGLIIILPSQVADVQMRMFNADGSESEMCGNGIRCVAKYSYEHELSRKNPMCIESGGRVFNLDLQISRGKVEQATVNLGRPELEAKKIPVDLDVDRVINYPLPNDDPRDFIPQWWQDCGLDPNITCVNTGNPHVVLFCDDVSRVPLETVGPELSDHRIFPRRANVHFAQIISQDEIRMRSWERGSGITLGCGSGACAVCVAGVLTARAQRAVLMHLPGGELTIEWREGDGCIYMTGPATQVFSGDWPD